MSGLACGVCGIPWRLDKPLLYHGDRLHCDSHACSRDCDECKDWERAIEDGATPYATGADQKAGVVDGSSPNPASTRDSEQERGNPATAEPTRPPPSEGYAAMMAKLKGSAKK